MWIYIGCPTRRYHCASTARRIYRLRRSLESQIAAWRLRLQPGGSDCSLEGQPGGPLEPQGAIWNPTGGHLQLQVAMWSFGMSFEGPGVHLKLQVAIWRSRWAFGAPGGSLELQLAFGAPGGHL